MTLLMMTTWAALLVSSTAQGISSSLGFAGGLPQDIFGVSAKEQKFLTSGQSPSQQPSGLLRGFLGKLFSENSFGDFSNGDVLRDPGFGGAINPFVSDFSRGPDIFFGGNDDFIEDTFEFNGDLPGSFLDFSGGLGNTLGFSFDSESLSDPFNNFVNDFGINDNSFETFSGNNIPLLGGFVSSLNGPGGSFGGLRGSEGFVSNLRVSSDFPRTSVGNDHFIAFESPSGVILIPSAALT
nr:uncharacterized protein LOC123753205 [Procambarus clarkii]